MERRTLYRADATCVTKVTGTMYPDKDSEGQVIFVNKHFESESEAWEKVIDTAEAYVSLAGSSIATAKERLADAERIAGDAAERFCRAKDNFSEWQRSSTP